MKTPRRKERPHLSNVGSKSAAVAATTQPRAIHKETGERGQSSGAAGRAGALVREMRAAKQWSQSELARATGRTQEQISQIERGTGLHGPTFDVIESLARACGFEMLFVNSSEIPAIRAQVGVRFDQVIADKDGR